jgi:membrane-associated phospholipid phosphatase
MSAPAHVRPARVRYFAAIVALAGVWLTMLLFGRGALDRSIYEALYAGSRPFLLAAPHVFTALGEPTVLIGAGIIVAAWLWWRKRTRLALALLAVFLVGRGLTEVQKYWIARARPDLEAHLVVVKTSSFPSGHAASSMIFYLTIALALTTPGPLRRTAAAGAILLSLLIGTSRVMLGVHWPSDVIGGWSFGLLWVSVTLPRTERLFGADSRTAQKQL